MLVEHSVGWVRSHRRSEQRRGKPAHAIPMRLCLFGAVSVKDTVSRASPVAAGRGSSCLLARDIRTTSCAI